MTTVRDEWTDDEAAPGIGDAELREALQSANVPTLLMVLIQMTGDQRWMADRFRPTRTRGMEDNDSGGLPEQVQDEIRHAAFHAIKRWQAGAPFALPRPSDAELVRMLSFSMGELVPEEYGPMIADDLSLPNDGEETMSVASPEGFSAVIIGAGLSGIAAAVNLGRAGIPYVVYEREHDLGGTWRDNRYPGSGVDTPNHLYSFSFAENDWSQFYAMQPELHAYLRQVAESCGVTPHLRFGHRVLFARYRSATHDWQIEVESDDGRVHEVVASIVISAVGVFGTPRMPDIPGLHTFAGQVVHTANWRDEVDLAGRRVAVIGNGASAMQLVPAVAQEVEQLTVYQRSPQWAAPFEKFRVAVPVPVRHLLTEVPLYRHWYRARLAWTFNDKVHPSLQKDPRWPHPHRSVNAINDGHRAYFTRHVEEQLGDRTDLLSKVVPTYPPFGKRMLLDNGWFQALLRDNVELVTTPISHIDASGVVTADGVARPADVLIAATGFDVVRFLSSYEVIGRTGTSLRETWHEDDARAYLGMLVPDFPNFFILYGPNAQAGHGGSLIRIVEIQLNYLMSLLGQMFRGGLASADIRPEVFEQYNREIDTAHESMVWTHPGMDVYYRNARGRVVVNTPFRIVDFWSRARVADLDEFRTEPRADDDR